jgi:hypothetical protein
VYDEVDQRKIDFFVDDTLVIPFSLRNKTDAIWPYNQPFILLNMAIGGNFGGPEVDDNTSSKFYYRLH